MLIESVNVGNLFIGRNDDICAVINIHSEDIPFVDIINKQGVVYRESFDSLRPIQLNEEWLYKFNYTVDEERFSEYMDKNLCDDGEEGFYSGNMFSLEENTFYIGDTKLELICSIVYVHQFQNWHYLLTGNKLKI